MAITLTPTQVLLLDLLISNAIKAALREISELSPNEVQARIAAEEARRNELMARL